MKHIAKPLALMLVMLMAFSCIPTVRVSAVEFSTDTDGYYLVETPAQLKSLMDSTGKINGNYRLANDIDMTGIGGQSPIGDSASKYFDGVFDGNGYAIKGLDITESGIVALFGYAKSSVIKNLTVYGEIKNTSTKAPANGSVNICTAGIVGSASNGITIQNCTSYANVTGNGYCGGIAGLLLTTAGNVTVSNCVNYGTIKSSHQFNGGIIAAIRADEDTADAFSASVYGCVNYGLVDGESICELDGQMISGGIIGWAACFPLPITVSFCTNYGEVVVKTSHLTDGGKSEAGVGGIIGRVSYYMSGQTDATSVTNCINVGNIVGDYFAGGIVGYMCDKKSTKDTIFCVEECVNVGAVTAFRYAAGIVGYAQYQSAAKLNVSDCYNSGTTTAVYTKKDYTVSAGIVGGSDGVNITECVDAGTQTMPNVATPTRMGGIVGYGIKGNASNSYTLSANICGSVEEFVTMSTCKTIEKAALAVENTFIDFDFVNTWRMTANGPVIRNVGANTLNVTNSEKGRGLALRDDGEGSFSIRKTYSITVQEVDDVSAPVVEFGVLFRSAANDTPFTYFNGGMYYGAASLDAEVNHENGIGKSVCYLRDSVNNDAAAVKLYNWDGNSSEVTYTGVLCELNEVDLLTMAFTFADYKVKGTDAQSTYVGDEITFSAQDIARIILADADLSDLAQLTDDQLVAYKVLSTINPYTFVPVE